MRGKFASLYTSNVYGVELVRPTPFFKKTYGVLGGVLEEGRVSLHLVKLYAHLSGKAIDVPAYITSLGGNLQITSQDLNCEHHFTQQLELKLSKALFCPLKFGAQGL